MGKQWAFFLKQIVIGSEKWIVYSNLTCKRLWKKAGDPPQRTTTAGLDPQKAMLLVELDWKGIFFQNHQFNSLLGRAG